MTSLNDIMWLAGWMEGEGSFSICRSNKTPYISMQGTSTDKDVIDRVASIVGTKVYGPYNKRSNWKPAYSFTVTGKLAASWIMTLFPLMGSRRQVRMLECLDTWKTECPGRWATKATT